MTLESSSKLDLEHPLEMAVLKIGTGTARCRPLGGDLELTFRNSRVFTLVPGEIVTVKGRKQCVYEDFLYLTGDIVDHRLDAVALGLTPLELRDEGLWDPADWLPTDEGEILEEWDLAVARRGPRPSFCMEDSTPRFGDGDWDDDPILKAVELKCDHDFDGARKILMDLLGADLRCLDAHAHLGNLIYDRWPAGAIRHYAAGVEIGGLSFPADFDGMLMWGRCLHGYALCLWRLGRVAESRDVFDRLLWLNPTDNQGVRAFLQLEGGQTMDGGPRELPEQS